MSNYTRVYIQIYEFWMNLNMIRPKNGTEVLILWIFNYCETLIEQTHTKHQETLDFKLIKPRKTIRFNPPIQIKGDWMIRLTDLEVYNFFLIKQKKQQIRTLETSWWKSWRSLIRKSQRRYCKRLGNFGYHNHQFIRWYNRSKYY